MKQENILIDDIGNARISDVGLAPIFLENECNEWMTRSMTPAGAGSLRYVAPELIMAEDEVRETTASDVYALGCVALEVLDFLYNLCEI